MPTVKRARQDMLAGLKYFVVNGYLHVDGKQTKVRKIVAFSATDVVGFRKITDSIERQFHEPYDNNDQLAQFEICSIRRHYPADVEILD